MLRLGVLLLCVGLTLAQSEEWQKAVLNKHNALRRRVAKGQEMTNNVPQAKNMEKMVWDSSLAAQAQAYASRCNWGHDNNRGSGIGENIAMNSRTDTYDAMVQAWYDEVKLAPVRDYNKMSDSDFNNGLGHYTQVVWAKSNKLGCGYAKGCKSQGYSMEYLVCRYSPAGNFMGRSIFNVGTTCSECAQCDDGLCGSGGDGDGDGGSTTSKPTNAPTCKDDNSGCPQWKSHCGKHDYVDKNCKKTCGTCGDEGSTTQKTTTTTSTTPSCKDDKEVCPYLKKHCGSHAWTDKYCKKTCGTCDDGSTTASTAKPTTSSSGDCKDDSRACPGWAKEGACHKVKEHCKKSCGLCGDGTTATQATTTHKSTTTTQATTTPKPTTSAPPCKDQNEGCPHWKRYCGNHDWITKNCKKTCGTCGDGGSTTPKTTTTSPTTTSAPSCKDEKDVCPYFEKHCGKHAWTDKYCKKTCGTCEGGSTTASTAKPTTSSSGDCKDDSRACPGWAKEGACHKVKEHCKKSCGLC